MLLAAIILAGGRSSRMGGGDKPLLELAGRPMLDHVIGRLKPEIDLIAINANGNPKRFASFDVPVVADSSPTLDGPLAGILAGMIWANAKSMTHLLSVSGDTPFFPPTLPQRLSALAFNEAIAIAESNGRVHPTFALWPVVLRHDLSAQISAGMRRVVEFIARHPSVAVPFTDIEADGASVDPFFNINTPEDLAQARVIAARLGL